MADNTFELTDPSSSPSFDRRFRKRQARKHGLQLSNTVTPPHNAEATAYPLLLCLRLIAHHNIHVFSTVGRGRRWNMRESLGKGITFTVEQADIPIREALGDWTYTKFAKGQRMGYFADHTGTKWSWDTVVAYKSIRDRKSKADIMPELVKELRVLCHQPLQNHPNIVRLLGLTWLREEDMASSLASSEVIGTREWPVILTEKATLGSLSEFLRSGKELRSPISLVAKLNFAGNILLALTALHACGILHGDIKCENALVFLNTKGTAENWTAKVADFGHSVLGAIGRTSHIKRQDIFIGTELYAPPELTNPSAAFHKHMVDKIDIWCFGMLLWQLLIDGDSYNLDDGCRIDTKKMDELRNAGMVSSVAQSQCRAYMERKHRDNPALNAQVLGILAVALDNDSRRRPSAQELSSRVLKLNHRQSSDTNSAIRFSEVESLVHVPLFDTSVISHTLTKSTLQIPYQVFEELTALMSSPGPYSTKATLELGFCYAEGFGTDVDYAKAVSLISKAAHEGLWQARAILGRAAAALNIRLEPEIQSNVYNWLLETSQMGSISAKQDLMVLPYGHEQCGKRKDTGVRKSTQSAAPATTSGNVNEGLIEAAKSGSVEMAELFIQQDADVHHSDQAGCTALHYATLTSTSLALRLLSLGANVLLRSNSVMPLSDEHFLGNEIPADTSPLILSVMANNIIVFEEFLVAAMKEMEPVNAKTMITEILVAGVKLQSVDCIRSVCMRYPMNDASQFDKDGYTPLSYAVRPRMIHHIIHYQPERRHGDSNQTARNDIPVLARQVNVVCTLLEVGSTLQMEEDVSTNCLHLAAAESDTVILSSLLDYCTKLPSNLLEQPSHDEYDGLTPLGVAIRFGRLDAVHVLLDRGANPKKAWPSIRGHALHCCAMFPSEDAVDIAAEILRRDKKSLNRKDIDGRTPLHCAAFREHSEMVQFLIKEGASLLVGDERSYTPLGAAVAARSIRSIQAICEALKKDRLPFYSLSFPVGGRFIPQIMSYSPMDHLLHPGTVSPAREPEMRIESGSRDWGCCDYPFSKPSQNVLKLLLEYYEHNIKLGTNFLEMICFPIWSYSGIHPAICMGNIEAVEIILASKKFVQDFRVLAIYAHHQLLVGRSHIASEDTRLKMVDLLQRHQKDDYLSLRKKRCVSWSRWIWLAYYTLYGDMEQKQFERALAWLGENRRYEYRPPLLEYLPWVPTRYSFLLVLFTLSWLFQAPAIVCLSLVLPDPAINFDKHDIIIAGLMLFMINFLMFFPQTFAIFSVVYRRCRPSYQGNDGPLIIMQMGYCWFTTLVSILLLYALSPAQHVIIEDDAVFIRGLRPGKRRYLEQFQSLTQALMGTVSIPMALGVFIFITLCANISRRFDRATRIVPGQKMPNETVSWAPWWRTGHAFG